MPDKRKHRGPNPKDQILFSVEIEPILKQAVGHFSQLLTLGYANKSALKLVGDHFSLTVRQRLAVMRASCSDSQLTSRPSKAVSLNSLKGQYILIDGYNLLITTEAALSAAPIFRCRDSCIRDLASVHGSYRKVEETIPALNLIAKTLNDLNIANALFLLDRPVSNSGRLKTIMTTLAQDNNYPWQIELVPSPDKKLIDSDNIIATSDSHILDDCKKWINLAEAVIDNIKLKTWLIDLA
ncbi:MAG: DUF434 domain-containing protein [Anaerohalosphaera sp.]|nr:DUF434 domain-containing protein [Anaerohalosphaera sp.]